MSSGNGHRVLQWASGAGGLPPQELTFARVLQGRGYVTGLVGERGRAGSQGAGPREGGGGAEGGVAYDVMDTGESGPVMSLPVGRRDRKSGCRALVGSQEVGPT